MNAADTPAVRLIPVPAEVALADQRAPLGGRPESDRAGPTPPAVELLLAPAPGAASLCGISEASWYRLKAAGKLPAPVKLGGRVLWRVEELRRWCAEGCPDLRTWQALENASSRHRQTGR
jgi:predicted DNA-binding transcriptional regulator AlpA